MTRLTEHDVRALIDRLPAFDAGLERVAGIDLGTLALRSCGVHPDDQVLEKARIACLPISSGLGFIPCFSRCIEVILKYLGCDAFATDEPDVKGLQQAVAAEAEVVFAADDDRFVAVNIRRGVCADDDPCTAHGYVTVLEAAAGSLDGRYVLLLGQGPVGRAAGRRLLERGARPLVVEPHAERARPLVGLGARLVTLEEGLEATGLVIDATPAANLIGAAQVTEQTIAAVPGLPSAFTQEAQNILGDRHIHEPLAIGVAVMAVEALTGRVSRRA